jgi:hypothetical protein
MRLKKKENKQHILLNIILTSGDRILAKLHAKLGSCAVYSPGRKVTDSMGKSGLVV